MNINKVRTAYIVLSVVLGVVVAISGHSYIHNNNQAISIIVNIFSILSGFLIVIITMVGDTSYLANVENWRTLELNRDRLITRLYRHKLLFLLYLTTLALIFIAFLVKDKYPDLYSILERIFFGFAVTSFVLSFSLPFSLIKTQIKKHDLLIECYKNQKGSKYNS